MFNFRITNSLITVKPKINSLNSVLHHNTNTHIHFVNALILVSERNITNKTSHVLIKDERISD
jgi:hypothetical protein